MTDKTEFSTEELSNILTDYDLGEYQDHKALEQGADQTNILLVTTQGKFAFKYYEKRSLDYVRFEVDLLEHLAKHNYPSPVPARNRHGDSVGLYNNKPFALFSFLEGEHSEDEENYKQVARGIAKLHLITEGYQPPHYEIRDTFNPAVCLQDAESNARQISSKEEASTRLAWLNAELEKVDVPGGLPIGVCRGDMNPGNFLYKNGKLSAVLDFDQASYSYLIYDLANMIGWWAWPDDGELNITRARELIKQYERIRTLTSKEKNYLRDALKMLCISGIGWFIHEDEEYYEAKEKINYLNSVSRKEFYEKLF